MVVPKRKDGMPRSMTQKKEKKGATMSQKKRYKDDSREKRHNHKEKAIFILPAIHSYTCTF